MINNIVTPIAKQVPMPEVKTARGAVDHGFPFHEMEIGDSFWTNWKPKQLGVYLRRQRPKYFIQRKEIVDGIVGNRVWRVDGPSKLRKAKHVIKYTYMNIKGLLNAMKIDDSRHFPANVKTRLDIAILAQDPKRFECMNCTKGRAKTIRVKRIIAQ